MNEMGSWDLLELSFMPIREACYPTDLEHRHEYFPILALPELASGFPGSMKLLLGLPN